MSLVSRTPFQLTGRYAERNRWENLAGPGDSRPTGLKVVEDEGLLDGAWGADKVCLVTGVSSGAGTETVRALAATGATVYGTARDLDKARAALGPELLATGRVHVLFVDQADLASVRRCAAEFRQRSDRLNVLVNNAAVMNTPQSFTKDGFELQFGTNHLSHFLLFHELRDLLLASSTPAFHSRVVNVTSAGHKYGPLDLDDVNFTASPSTRPYNGWAAYGASKTANIYMTTQIERLYGGNRIISSSSSSSSSSSPPSSSEQAPTAGGSKIHGYAVHPGGFESPNLQKHSAAEMAAANADPRTRRYLSDVRQGCATSVYAAVSAELEGRGGLYLEGCAVAGPAPADSLAAGDALEYGYGGWAFDEALEGRLWEKSLEWVGAASS